MTSSPIIEPLSAAFPPVVQSQIDRPIVHRRSWLTTIAPAYLGVFVWVPFLDPLGTVDQGSAGLLSPFLSALLALIAGYLLLYDRPARLGWSSGERLPVVASASLGTEGAEWIAGVLYGLFGLVWCAVSIYFSVKLILLGLISWNLIDAAGVLRGNFGGLPLESPLFLICVAFWTFIITAANGLRLVSVIAALLKVYAPVAALLLILAAAWAWAHVVPDGTLTSRPATAALIEPRIFQLVFGYFAFAGLMGVEWGAAVRERRDVRIGGWLGILAAGAVTVLSALVLGASDPGVSKMAGGLDWIPARGSFQGALFRGIGATAGSKAAGLLLLLFGVAALAPACYGSAIYTSRFRAHWPVLQKRAGVCLGCGLIFVLAATALAARLETIFTISGALFAPVAGVMTAESLLSRGRWTGVRGGWRLPGVSAWSLGVLIGLAPVMEGLTGSTRLGSIQPAALYAYLAAVIVYGAASLLGPNAPTVAIARAERSGDA
ncbi:MAG: hypothetical protein P4L85_02110 [Paludisphaera borealis]|uniref:hypothetical protein n=1 Tax=Paludisphaera borealis TaxID=1387353 RepID=UPI00284F6516|nr:hypothetical protein [Paludisphaera borealis]MDR3618116.1 hypothetical protein [Paludisphaera borealis]